MFAFDVLDVYGVYGVWNFCDVLYVLYALNFLTFLRLSTFWRLRLFRRLHRFWRFQRSRRFWRLRGFRRLNRFWRLRYFRATLKSQNRLFWFWFTTAKRADNNDDDHFHPYLRSDLFCIETRSNSKFSRTKGWVEICVKVRQKKMFSGKFIVR